MKTKDYKHIYDCIRNAVSECYSGESLINKTARRAFTNLLIGTPEEKQDIIDTFDLECCRVCEVCGELMVEGYLLDSSTLCSDECAAKWYNFQFKNENITPEDFAKLMSDGDEDSEWYWTEWF